MVHSSGKKFTHGRTNGLTDIQKSDLYSKVALAKNENDLNNKDSYKTEDDLKKKMNPKKQSYGPSIFLVIL